MHCKPRIALHCIAFNPARVDQTDPKNDAQITFRIPATDKQDLKAAAKRRKRPGHNWLARDIILKWLAQERRRRGK